MRIRKRRKRRQEQDKSFRRFSKKRRQEQDRSFRRFILLSDYSLIGCLIDLSRLEKRRKKSLPLSASYEIIFQLSPFCPVVWTVDYSLISRHIDLSVLEKASCELSSLKTERSVSKTS
jgi:hypothetical protein